MDSKDSKDSKDAKDSRPATPVPSHLDPAVAAPMDWSGHCHTACEERLGRECSLCRRAFAQIFKLCAHCPTPCPAARAKESGVLPLIPEKIYRDNGHENVLRLIPKSRPTPETPEPPEAA